MPYAIQVKSVLNKTKRRDPWFLDEYTINPYSGCSFNCLYCYIRGSKYGINMEEKTAVKSNALEVLEKQLHNRATKSDLVERDFDLLRQIDEQAIWPADLQAKLQRKVFITFSFITVDNAIGKQFEPGATPPDGRLLALRKAVADGFFSGVSLMPLLPYITDTKEHLQLMFSTFKEAGYFCELQ